MINLKKIDPIVRQALLSLPKSEDMLLIDKAPLLCREVQLDAETFGSSNGSCSANSKASSPPPSEVPVLERSGSSDGLNSTNSKGSAGPSSSVAKTEAALMDMLAKSMADMPDFENDSDKMMMWAADQGFFDDLPGGAAVQARRNVHRGSNEGDLFQEMASNIGYDKEPRTNKQAANYLKILEPDVVKRLELEEQEWQLVQDARSLKRAFFETPNLKDPLYSPPTIMQFSEALSGINMEIQYFKGSPDTHKGSIIRTYPVVDLKRPKLWQRRAGSKPNDLTFNPRSMVTRVVCSFSPTRTSLKIPKQAVSKPKSSLHKKLASNFRRMVSL